MSRSHSRAGAEATTDGEPDLRQALGGLQELLAMSMLMLDRHDVDDVIDVLLHWVEPVTRCQLVRVTFRRDQRWVTVPPGEPASSSLRSGGRAIVEDHGSTWTCTTAVAALSGPPGQLVLSSSIRPDTAQLFVIERLGDLLGAALVDAELHERDHRRAMELDEANAELACTLDALRHREAVQEEFLQLAATGSELDLATSLSRLTGCTVVVRDGFAYETARIDAPSAQPPAETENPLVAVIGGRPELGTVELEGGLIGGRGNEDQNFALQYASVALGLIRAHATAMSEMENRLCRDLLEDLVDGLPTDVAVARAAAQGHDLRVPHDLLVTTWETDTGSRADNRDVDRVRSALSHQRLPCLVARHQGMVVVLAHHGVDFRRLYDDLCHAHGDKNGVVAMGEPISSPDQVPRSLEQARRALTARQQSSQPHGPTAYADLGVERILALDGNVREVERLMSDWLGDLMRYDHEHGSDLVATLAAYLDLGGKYDDTARALSIHRNTLRYRLSRIAEVSGHDLADVDTKLNLHLAARAWRVRRAEVH